MSICADLVMCGEVKESVVSTNCERVSNDQVVSLEVAEELSMSMIY